MMRALLLISIVAFSAGGSFAQTADTRTPAFPRCGNRETEAALLKVADRWRDSYNQGNPDAVADLYAEDGIYITQHFIDGIVHGKALIRAYVALGTKARYHVDALDVVATACSSDFAYAITRYRSTNGPAKDTGYNLVVLRRISGTWLIVAHEAAVPDPATAIRDLSEGMKR